MEVSAAALPAQERPHNETGLFGTISVFRADRTSAPGAATKAHAISAGLASNVARARRDVIAGA